MDSLLAWYSGGVGVTGTQGPQWPQGLQWIQWPQWVTWATGPKWVTWEQGSQWIQWPQWIQWSTGAKWDTWSQGIQGPQGLQWPAGLNGTNWVTGAIGPQWPAGRDGIDWAAWTQGIQGIQWDTWAQWLQWTKWDTWAQWLQWTKWDTWAQWIQWLQWLQGLQWLQWVTWAIPDHERSWTRLRFQNTFWWRWSFVNLIGPQGLQWIQWNTWAKWDTGAQGPQWLQWPQGATWTTWIQGIPWATGATGAKWDTWAQGIQGPQGLQWIQWNTWTKWDTWAKWDTWSIWLQGIKWNTWANGVTWLQGIQGVTWATGPKWTTGTFIGSENDPIYRASVAATISSSLITNWNTAYDKTQKVYELDPSLTSPSNPYIAYSHGEDVIKILDEGSYDNYDTNDPQTNGISTFIFMPNDQNNTPDVTTTTSDGQTAQEVAATLPNTQRILIYGNRADNNNERLVLIMSENGAYDNGRYLSDMYGDTNGFEGKVIIESPIRNSITMTYGGNGLMDQWQYDYPISFFWADNGDGWGNYARLNGDDKLTRYTRYGGDNGWIYYDDKVGIGTSDPQNKLDVVGGWYSYIRSYANDGTDWGIFLASNIGGNDYRQRALFSQGSDGSFLINDDHMWTTRFSIKTDNWYAGINTDSPEAQLDVNGDARIRNIPFDSSLTGVLVVDENWYIRKNDSSMLVGPRWVTWAAWNQGIQWLQWAKWDTWVQWIQWPQWITWTTPEHERSWTRLRFQNTFWWRWSFVNLIGPQWLQGTTWATWLQWIQGIQWVTGAIGVKWDTWAQGPQGVTWALWLQGLQWIQGNTWVTGAIWSQGIQGLQWLAGTTWAKWDTGIQWIKWNTWANGITWLQWLQGIQGNTWATGPKWATGTFIGSENDPVYRASIAAGITSDSISNWNTAYSKTPKVYELDPSLTSPSNPYIAYSHGEDVIKILEDANGNYDNYDSNDPQTNGITAFIFMPNDQNNTPDVTTTTSDWQTAQEVAATLPNTQRIQIYGNRYDGNGERLVLIMSDNGAYDNGRNFTDMYGDTNWFNGPVIIQQPIRNTINLTYGGNGMEQQRQYDYPISFFWADNGDGRGNYPKQDENGRLRRYSRYGRQNGNIYYNDGGVNIGSDNTLQSDSKLEVTNWYLRIKNAEGNGENLRLGSAWGNPGIWNENDESTLSLVLGNENPNNIIFMTRAEWGPGGAGEAMRITRSNNVGIWTNDPQSKLQIKQSDAGAASNKWYIQDGLIYENDGNARFDAYPNSQWLGWLMVSDPLRQMDRARFFFDNSNDSWTLDSDGVKKMVVNWSGKVGIGTDTPQYKLDINGDVRINAQEDSPQISLLFRNTNSQSGRITSQISSLDENGINNWWAFAWWLWFYTHPSGDNDGSVLERMRITNQGNVGIGTSSPTSQLQVSWDIQVGNLNWQYRGNPDTDGSWRMWVDGSDFVIQKRVGGDWVTKQTISG